MTRRPVRAPLVEDPSGLAREERERIRRSFLAMALAHEIKQPLNSLNLNAELLSKRLAKLASAPDVASPLAALLRVVDRVAGCVESFYVRVQPDPVPMTPTQVVPILEAALQRAEAPARKAGVRLRLEAPTLMPIPVHPDQMALALDALLENAIQASPRGAEVLVSAVAGEDEVRISIADRGEGMTPDVARRAVEIGFTTRPGADGTGLTVAKFVAYHHAGGFQVETRPGAGTRVTLALPLTAE